MKKIVLIVLLLITGCSTKEEVHPLKAMGYTEEEIAFIEKVSNENVSYIESLPYNTIYISLINHTDFEEENLKNYITALDNSEMDLETIIFLVNNEYYDTSITYGDTTLSFMKSKYYIHDNLNRYLAYEKQAEQKEYDKVITTVNSMVDNPFYTNTVATDLSKGYLMIVNKYHYLENNYVPSNLVTIDAKYGKVLQLEETTYQAFISMYNDASKDGVNLYIFSPYRSYNTQLGLYNYYVNRDGKTLADTYSARAGHSEHQTGLAIDISKRGKDLRGFEDTNEFKWLKENAYKYGFILRYPEGKEWITGYDYEPWHYRYVGIDVAKQIYEEDITFEEYYAYYIEKSSN